MVMGQSVSLDGTTYTQDFNTLEFQAGPYTTLPNGWYILETGPTADNAYNTSNGSNNAADTYSYGGGGQSPDQTDRALGTLRLPDELSSFASSFGVQFTNITGETIISMDVAYTGEQWRMGQAGPLDQLVFEYSTDATSLSTGTWTEVTDLTFTSVTNTGGTPSRTLNGNDPTHQDNLSATISSLNIADGQTVWFHWTDFNMTGTFVFEDGLSVDDLSVTTQSISNNTEVYFPVTAETVDESAGSYLLFLGLFNPDPVNATTFDLALVGGTGTPADIGNFVSPRMITVPAATPFSFTVITITDDMDVEGDETLIFELQNAAGGNNAQIGSPNQFTLTILDNDIPPLHYRSAVANGLWNSASSWEVSVDGNAPWTPATTPPLAIRGPISILSGNTITINSFVEIDEVTIDAGGTLVRSSNNLTILDGPGVDLTVNGNLIHQGGNPIVFSGAATMQVNASGIVEVQNNAVDQSTYGTSTAISWAENSQFYWNVNSPFAIGTYFPNTPNGDRPRFRVNQITSSIGNANPLVINGIFEIPAAGTITFAGTGVKEFREGIRGNGNIVQATGSGQFQITGIDALLAGINGATQLNPTQGLLIAPGATVVYSGNKPFNGGPITVDGQLLFGSGTKTMTISHSGTGTIGLQGTGEIDMAGGGSAHTIRIASETPTFVPTFALGPDATIEYYSNDLQNIAAINYTNLVSSGTGDRVLPDGGTIGISGDFTAGTNTYTTVNSTVEFNGTNQSVGGINYFNLSLLNGGTKTLAGDATLDSYLTVAAATTFDTNGNAFTLISGATETASITALPASAVINGDITTQRYIRPVAEIFRYVASPISNPAVSQVQDDIPITGTFTGADAVPGWLPDPSFFYYDESVNGFFDFGFMPYPVTSNAETLENGRGYSVFVRDGSSPKVLDFTGTINRGDLTLPMSYTTSTPAEPQSD